MGAPNADTSDRSEKAAAVAMVLQPNSLTMGSNSTLKPYQSVPLATSTTPPQAATIHQP